MKGKLGLAVCVCNPSTRMGKWTHPISGVHRSANLPYFSKGRPMRWMTPEEQLTSGLCTLAYIHTHRHTIVYAHNTLRMKMTLNKAANAQFQNLTSNRWLPPREHTAAQY